VVVLAASVVVDSSMTAVVVVGSSMMTMVVVPVSMLLSITVNEISVVLSMAVAVEVTSVVVSSEVVVGRQGPAFAAAAKSANARITLKDSIVRDWYKRVTVKMMKIVNGREDQKTTKIRWDIGLFTLRLRNYFP
jgi:hypothetical protein